MKSTDAIYAATVEKLRAFLGREKSYQRHFAESSEAVLKHTSFPGQESADVRQLIQRAEELLTAPQSQLPPPDKGESLLALRKLGKPRAPRMGGQAEEERHIERLALRMASTLAAFDEEVSLHLMHARDADGWNSRFIISTGSGDAAQAVAPLLRSVYADYAAEPFAAPADALSSVVYGRLVIPCRDKNIDEDESAPASWITAVANVLPEVGACRLTVRFVPLTEENEHVSCRVDPIAARRDELCELRSALQRASEADWNHSTTIGANKQLRSVNIIEKMGKVAGDLGAGDGHEAFSKRDLSANYSDSFGETRHEKNKRVEMLCNEIDRELYRIDRALRTRAWKVEIRLATSPDDPLTAQVVCSAMSGALKSAHYDLQWDVERCAAFAAGTQEMLPLMMFPTREFSGLEFVPQEEFSLTSPVDSQAGLSLGSILWNSAQVGRFYLPTRALNRHAFVCGMTGSGKTNTVFRLLGVIQTPFLVIEPVKGEYRALRAAYPDLRTYTMRIGSGGDGVELLRINPFWFPLGTSIAFHIDSIKTVIASAFDMSAAMPNILEQCLYAIYVRNGWDLVTNRNIYEGELPEAYLYPTFEDLQAEVDAYIENADFGDEVKGNYRGAMSARLLSFLSGAKGLLLNTREIPDYTALSQGRAILELEGLADDADKCLVMGTILVQYFENLKLTFHNADRGLTHLLVIEEAHRLFKNVPKQAAGTEGANVAGQLVESLSNIMAEIRAFGEGMVIVDQSPSKIAEDVIKNSGTKMIHRIDNSADAQLLQASLLIPEDQTSLPGLCQGEALIRTEGMNRPCKVRVDFDAGKDAYSLSNSFQQTAQVDPALQIEFAAATFLSREGVAKDMQDLFATLLVMLQSTDDADRWYEFTDQAVRLIQQERIVRQNMEELIPDPREFFGRMLTAALRQMHRYESMPIGLRDNGMLQLFAARLMDAYWTQRTGGPVKTADWQLLRHFLHTRLSNVVEIIKLESNLRRG